MIQSVAKAGRFFTQQNIKQGQALALLVKAEAYTQHHKFIDAEAHLLEAWHILGQVGLPLARIQTALVKVWFKQNRQEEAIALAQHVLQEID